MPALTIVVLISGNGANLQAIIDAKRQGLPVDIRAVISNQADAFGIVRAKKAHIPVQIVSHSDYPSRDTFEAALKQTIDRYSPQTIVLAGFMRKLCSTFVAHYAGHIINIHPSLLPQYPGLHTHRRVLAAGDQEHGASIHFVTDAVDAGPLICQARLKVHPEDTEDSLKYRVQQLEHFIYPKVLEWLARGRLILQDHQVLLDGQ